MVVEGRVSPAKGKADRKKWMIWIDVGNGMVPLTVQEPDIRPMPKSEAAKITRQLWSNGVHAEARIA